MIVEIVRFTAQYKLPIHYVEFLREGWFQKNGRIVRCHGNLNLEDAAISKTIIDPLIINIPYF